VSPGRSAGDVEKSQERESFENFEENRVANKQILKNA
jgi:hypothetical protein